MAHIYYLQKKKKNLNSPNVGNRHPLGMPLLPTPPRPRCPIAAYGGMAGAAMVGEGRNWVEEGGVEVEQKRVAAVAGLRGSGEDPPSLCHGRRPPLCLNHAILSRPRLWQDRGVEGGRRHLRLGQGGGRDRLW